ncbi:MAG TPA: tail fiber protein [Acetobacteraceae bacterium]|jgi:microcystin-dependent protein
MDNFLGQITLFACTYAPVNWAMCQGQAVPISQYSALFALLGTTYGGNGTTTFGLPDLRGRVPNSVGQGQDLSNYVLGGRGGVATVALAATNVPPHTHNFPAYTVTATTGKPALALPATGSSSGEREHVTATKLYNTASPNVTLSSNFVGPVEGGARPHDNMQPSLALNWCIALSGVSPPHPAHS